MLGQNSATFGATLNVFLLAQEIDMKKIANFLYKHIVTIVLVILGGIVGYFFGPN